MRDPPTCVIHYTVTLSQSSNLALCQWVDYGECDLAQELHFPTNTEFGSQLPLDRPFSSESVTRLRPSSSYEFQNKNVRPDRMNRTNLTLGYN